MRKGELIMQGKSEGKMEERGEKLRKYHNVQMGEHASSIQTAHMIR